MADFPRSPLHSVEYSSIAPGAPGAPGAQRTHGNSQETVSCCLPDDRHHGQLFGRHPARAGCRTRPAGSRGRQGVVLMPDSSTNQHGLPTALSCSSPSLSPAGRAELEGSTRGSRTPPPSAGSPGSASRPLPGCLRLHGPGTQRPQELGDQLAPCSAARSRVGGNGSAPSPQGAGLPPRQRRNAEELDLLERK